MDIRNSSINGLIIRMLAIFFIALSLSLTEAQKLGCPDANAAADGLYSLGQTQTYIENIITGAELGEGNTRLVDPAALINQIEFLGQIESRIKAWAGIDPYAFLQTEEN